MSVRFYWRDGTPASSGAPTGSDKWVEEMTAFQKRFSDLSYKTVARTRLPNGRLVSTVWLGFDHGILASRPLIFETMVFPCDGDSSSLDCRRYSTEAEAVVGHEELVATWSAGGLPEAK